MSQFIFVDAHQQWLHTFAGKHDFTYRRKDLTRESHGVNGTLAIKTGITRCLSAARKVPTAAAVTAAMAAFRRLASLAGRVNLCSAARGEFVVARTAAGGRARRCLTFGMCLATGGAVALYFYNEMRSRGGWRRMRGHSSIHGLLPFIPTVEAKETVGDVCLLTSTVGLAVIDC